MPTVDQIYKKSDKELLTEQERLRRKIQKLYYEAIDDIVVIASSQKLPKGVFKLIKLNILNAKIDAVIDKMFKEINAVVLTGVNNSWDIANRAGDRLSDKYLTGSILPKSAKAVYYDKNLKALEAFEKRKINGLSLSQRIYKQSEVFKSELEAGLGVGIADGDSAAKMGRDLKQYLKEPDKLFRRVRDASGKLQLSKNAQLYHPGQGVYRSSVQNIRRLTRTETNMAYRNADVERWRDQAFVLGYEVRLSLAHPKYDVCDAMAGEYPKDFNFSGWHPNCLCHAVPITMSINDFKQYQKLVIAGTDTPKNVNKIAKQVKNIPASAENWIAENFERIQGWKSPPLFMQRNAKYVAAAIGE